MLALLSMACGPSEGDVFTLRPAIEHRTALSADSFVESIGVDIRLGWPGTDYTARFDDLILPALARLRVRHVRDDSVKALTEPANVELTSSLVARLPPAALAVTWIADPRLNVPAEGMGALLELSGGAVEAVEGPGRNQYAGVSLTDQQVREYLDVLVSTIPSGLPVVAPSANQATLGRVDEWVDYGHVALSLSGAPAAEQLDMAVDVAAGNSPNRPLVATSPGYQTTTLASQPVVPEMVAAKYLLRLCAGNFERRIVRTFLAPLLDLPADQDTGGTSQRGLLRSDGSEKPAFLALERLSALLADPGVEQLPGALPYRLRDAAGIREVLLSNRAGRFFVLVWQETASWDPLGASEIAVPERPVELELDSAHDLTVYSPLAGEAPIHTEVGARRITLSVPDHPLVVAIDP
jgi:hypothetical protein